MIRIDARVPVEIGGVDAPGTVRLAIPDLPVHDAGCACCFPRSAAARALSGLFTARGRGSLPWFDRVVVAPSDTAAVEAALAEDPLIAAWFRHA